MWDQAACSSATEMQTHQVKDGDTRPPTQDGMHLFGSAVISAREGQVSACKCTGAAERSAAKINNDVAAKGIGVTCMYIV